MPFNAIATPSIIDSVLRRSTNGATDLTYSRVPGSGLVNTAVMNSVGGE